MRTRYRARRDAMIEALAAELPDAEVLGIAAGLHVTVALPDGDDEAAMREEAARRRIALETMRDFRPAQDDGTVTLMLGYAAVPEPTIRAGVRELAAAIRLLELVAVELEEALHARLLAAELLGHAARVLGGDVEEVLQAALGVVGQRVHARDVLLGADDAHRRAALGERAGAADGGDDDPLLRRDERGREQPVRGQLDVERDPAVDLDAAVHQVLAAARARCRAPCRRRPARRASRRACSA